MALIIQFHMYYENLETFEYKLMKRFWKHEMLNEFNYVFIYLLN